MKNMFARLCLIQPTEEVTTIVRGKKKAQKDENDNDTGKYIESIALELHMQPCEENGKDIDINPIAYQKWFAKFTYASADDERHEKYETNGNWPILQDTLELLGWSRNGGMRTIDPCLKKTIDSRKVFSISIETDDKYGDKIAFINDRRKPVNKAQFADLFDEMLSMGNSSNAAPAPEDDLPF